VKEILSPRRKKNISEQIDNATEIEFQHKQVFNQEIPRQASLHPTRVAVAPVPDWKVQANFL